MILVHVGDFEMFKTMETIVLKQQQRKKDISGKSNYRYDGNSKRTTIRVNSEDVTE